MEWTITSRCPESQLLGVQVRGRIPGHCGQQGFRWRLKVSPTASRRCLPSFFFNAVSEAQNDPRDYGRLETWFLKRVRTSSSLYPWMSPSLNCCGRRLHGPLAESGGSESRASCMKGIGKETGATERSFIPARDPCEELHGVRAFPRPPLSRRRPKVRRAGRRPVGGF